MLNTTLGLDIKDYSSIFNSILPFVKNLRKEYALEESCVPMNFFAQNILKNKFSHLNPKFYVEHVIYNINDKYLSFYNPYNLNSKNQENWHTYIIIGNNNKEYYLDFMAPLFNEIIEKKTRLNLKIDKKMFQKEIINVKTIENFMQENVSVGDFYFKYNKEIHDYLMFLIQQNEKLNSKAKLALDLYNSENGYIKIDNKTIKKAENSIINKW